MDAFPKLLIIGHTNIDENIVTNHPPVVLPGGAGYFVAVAASRIIKPIGFVTRIGNDFDATFLKSRVLPEGIHTIADKNTSRSIQTYHSETDRANRNMQLLPGVSYDLCPKDIPKKWLTHTKHIHIATMPPAQQKSFIVFLKKYAPHITLSMDTYESLLTNQSNITMIEKLTSMVDIVFVNRFEYTILQSVLSSHPCVIHKTDKNGAEYLSRGTCIATAKAPIVNAIDSTGAGDIFAGTFLACRLSGQSIEKSLEEAVHVASTSILQEGIAHLF